MFALVNSVIWLDETRIFSIEFDSDPHRDVKSSNTLRKRKEIDFSNPFLKIFVS